MTTFHLLPSDEPIPDPPDSGAPSGIAARRDIGWKHAAMERNDDEYIVRLMPDNLSSFTNVNEFKVYLEPSGGVCPDYSIITMSANAVIPTTGVSYGTDNYFFNTGLSLDVDEAQDLIDNYAAYDVYFNGYVNEVKAPGIFAEYSQKSGEGAQELAIDTGNPAQSYLVMDNSLSGTNFSLAIYKYGVLHSSINFSVSAASAGNHIIMSNIVGTMFGAIHDEFSKTYYECE
ncbi:MAG: hypothetical protein DRQ62_09190 [Gammaproteobacteria bacterium]|nr:MAG: hypothetical protein DRQ62_09190 [Gammaproteobacteria bacterium]